MNNCNRYECFACVHGKCFALWDTSEQEKCRFYRTDLDMKWINKELSNKNRSMKEKERLANLTKAV